MTVKAYGLSDIGKVRAANEDAFLVDPELGLYMLCDGMGGHAAGEVASKSAIEAIHEYFQEHASEASRLGTDAKSRRRICELGEMAVKQACRRIYEEALEHPELRGMGTTGLVLHVVDGKAVVAHVGDCRLYLLRGDRIELLTDDHTMAQEILLAQGVSPEEAARSPLASVLTRCLGTHESVRVDSIFLDLVPGDRLLLCSDGLSRYFPRAQDLAPFLGASRSEDSARELIEHAREQGGEDNITVILLEVSDELASTAPGRESFDAIQRRLDALRASPLFHGLSLRQLCQVLEVASPRSLRAGDDLANEYDVFDGACVIVSGQLAVWRGDEELVTFGAGETIGKLALIRKRDSLARVEAIEATELLEIRRDSFASLARRLPRLGRRLTRNLLEDLAAELDGIVGKVTQDNPRKGWRRLFAEEDSASQRLLGSAAWF